MKGALDWQFWCWCVLVFSVYFGIFHVHFVFGLFLCIFCSYATVFTNFPVFSLVLDKDVSSAIAMTYPELYKDLTKVNYLYIQIILSIYKYTTNCSKENHVLNRLKQLVVYMELLYMYW